MASGKRIAMVLGEVALGRTREMDLVVVDSVKTSAMVSVAVAECLPMVALETRRVRVGEVSLTVAFVYSGSVLVVSVSNG